MINAYYHVSTNIILYRILLLPKNSPVLHLFKPLLPLQIPGNHSFAISLGLFFPQCHINNYAVCSLSDWLLSLNNTNLRFIHVFAWIDRSFLFITKQHSIV